GERVVAVGMRGGMERAKKGGGGSMAPVLPHQPGNNVGRRVMTGSDPVARLMFGAALRAQRRQAGMSLRDLGRAVHYDHSRLSRAENGEHLPALGYVRSIDAALGTGDLLATLHQLAERSAPQQTDLHIQAIAASHR